MERRERDFEDPVCRGASEFVTPGEDHRIVQRGTRNEVDDGKREQSPAYG